MWLIFAPLGLRRDFGNDFSIQAGFYKNSLSKWSTYAIAEYSPLSVGSFDAGLFAGIRTHYKKPVEFAGGALVRWRVTELYPMQTPEPQSLQLLLWVCQR